MEENSKLTICNKRARAAREARETLRTATSDNLEASRLAYLKAWNLMMSAMTDLIPDEDGDIF